MIDQYPSVVGVSIWDACNSRFEYFDPADGTSRHAIGGGGYFFFTGDGTHQITLADHGPVLRRRLEVLDAETFTYSRRVPRHFMDGQPEITLHVEHTPFTGRLPLPALPRKGQSSKLDSTGRGPSASR